MNTAKKNADCRIRKINALLTGDDAVDAELLIVQLGIGDSAKKKAEIDIELVKLAMEALNSIVEATKAETGNKHPSIADVRGLLKKRLIVAHD